ncbi:MAG: hypothetical protein MUC89_07210 [Acetobacteraceae bacterium]|jgi:hypothetical protein|nr:hypothetical protein [Acetobacteraceae bacterium]
MDPLPTILAALSAETVASASVRDGFGLEGIGKAMRHLTLPLGGGIDRGAVATLVRAATL